MRVADFYSVNEGRKPPGNRVFHNNSTCVPGRDIRRMSGGLAQQSAISSVNTALT